MKNEKKETAILLAVIVVVYVAGQAAGITCPILWLTGISCPGCGMTRAWLHVLQGDLAGAFAFHPLFLLPVLLLVLWLFRRRLSRRAKTGIAWVLIALVMIIWVVRFFLPGDPAAQFDPADGLLGRLLQP